MKKNFYSWLEGCPQRATVLLLGGLMLLSTAAMAKESPPKKKAEKSREKVEFKASLHTRLSVTDEADAPDGAFELNRARFGVTLRPLKKVTAQVEGAFEEVIRSGSDRSFARDAWVRIEVARWLEFKAGQFKKPLSVMENTGKGSLALVERGSTNRYIIRQLEWGSRDIGLQVSGRIWKGARLDYFLGVFNGAKLPSDERDPNGAKDIVGRLEGELFDGFRVGASGVMKSIDVGGANAEEMPERALLGSFDLRYKKRGGWAMAEVHYGENHIISNAPGLLGAVVAGAWRIDVPWWGSDGAIEPAVRVEFLDPDLVSEGKMLVFSGGVNFWLAEGLRVMLQGEWLNPDDELSGLWQETMRGWLQVAFDY
jgi:hypothetical protein